VTRHSSSTEFPSDPAITVKSANYDSNESLVSALEGNEALILMLNFQALGQPQLQLIDAAAEAGVKWILPTEFGSDNANQTQVNLVPINAMKGEPRQHIEKAAKTHPGLSWIGVVTNPWFDYVCNSSGQNQKP
jgi:NmrA-like family